MRDSLRGCLLAVLLLCAALIVGGTLGTVSAYVVERLTGNGDLSFSSFFAAGFLGFMLIFLYGPFWLYRSEDYARWHDSEAEWKIRNSTTSMGLIFAAVFGLWAALGSLPAWAVAIAAMGGAGVGAAVGHDFKRRYYRKIDSAVPPNESTARLTNQDADKAWTRYRRLRRLYVWSLALFVAALMILFVGIAIAAFPINIALGNVVNFWLLITTASAFYSLILLVPCAYFFKFMLETWECPQCGKSFGLKRFRGYPHLCQHCGFAIPKSWDIDNNVRV